MYNNYYRKKTNMVKIEGYLSTRELSDKYGIDRQVIIAANKNGLLPRVAHPLYKHRYLYKISEVEAILKMEKKDDKTS